jgi:hypothetical protein
MFLQPGIGYNGFPRGCSDDKLPWAKVVFFEAVIRRDVN